MKRATLAVPALLLIPAVASAQSGTLDQDNAMITNVSVNMAFPPSVYEQVVEVGVSGVLEGIVLRTAGTNTVTPDLPVKLYEWDALTLTKGSQLWSGGVPASNLPYFTNHFLDLLSANLLFDAGETFLIEVGDPVADLSGWGLSLNQGWDQATSMHIPLYDQDMYADGILDPLQRLVFETWVIEGGFGTPYCSSNPNSTGMEATLRAAGTPTVALNDVTLISENVPKNAFGFFLTSMTRGNTAGPGGSQGVLCLGGAIGRYVGPGQIQQAGAGGTISLALDLQQMPTPTGFVAVQAGETWNFQAWHRDAVGGAATSNFSQGIEI
ncbi:MAG: hypothetical protein AAGB93_22785, partial [Planctomycetota bacterium]